MTTHDRHMNAHSSDEDGPGNVRCDLNNAREGEILVNGMCDSNSEHLSEVPPVCIGQSSNDSSENGSLTDEKDSQSKYSKCTTRLSSNDAFFALKREAIDPIDNLENLDLHEAETSEDKPPKSVVERNEKIISLESAEDTNALPCSNENKKLEALEKCVTKVNLPVKDNKNGVKSIEKFNDSHSSPLRPLSDFSTEFASLERSDGHDIFPEKNCHLISGNQECSSSQESAGCDDLEVSCMKNGDDQNGHSVELTSEQQWKIEKIKAALEEPLLDTVQRYAEEDDGFITDELRREAWPRLLLVHESKPPPLLTLQQAQLHPSYSQVVMDVERTLKRFPPDISPERRRSLMDELIRVIMTVLQRNPHFHYYQGYHDVGITFLLVCGELTAVQLLEELSLTHLREFLQPTMERTQRWLSYIYPMIAAESPALYAHMDQAGVGTMFCLPWLITWYAHSLSQYRHVVRLYDFLLASPPLMPMYVAGVILLQREQQLLAVPCDMPMLHQALSSIPDEIPLEKIFREARLLYKRRPPSSLSDEVDRYLSRQKEREEAERAERNRRAAARKRGAGGGRPWWMPYALVRSGGAWVRTAGAVAVVAVVLGLASIYFRTDNKLVLPVQWSTERPLAAPQ